MHKEIERKFLVLSDAYKKESHQKIYIKQGFLNSDKERVVRIRITDSKGYITIKGKSDRTGISRFEWEKEISKQEAEQLLALCEKGMIEKYRFFVKNNQAVFEIDEFLGNNTGLVIAEIELQNENESFNKPFWLGQEVTGQSKYYNSNLSKHPFISWKK